MDKENKCLHCGEPIGLYAQGSAVLSHCLKLMKQKLKKGLGALLLGEINLNKGGFKMGEFQKSLNPASSTKYLPARVRATDENTIKFQGEGNMELSVSVDPKITTWIKGLPHPHQSMAGTEVKYAECQVIAHDKADSKVAEFAGPVRVQMAGKALNRDWGAEFVVDNGKLRSWAEQYHKYLTQQQTQKEQAAGGKLLDTPKPEEGEGEAA